MSNHVSLAELTGRRVVAADDATEIGHVRHVILSSDARRVDSVHISGKKKNADLVEWDDVASIGNDAVMVTSATSARQPSSDTDTDFVRGHVEIMGARVLDTEGYEIATVTDLEFDGESGDIVAVTSSAGRIEPNRIRSIGTFALVVDAEN